VILAGFQPLLDRRQYQVHHETNFPSNRMDSQEKPAMLLDQVRKVMRLHHYSLHTERRVMGG